MKTLMGKNCSRQSWLLLGVSLLPLAFATPAIAADEEETLDDVVVSANRTPTPIKQTASSVSVITADDIEKNQFVTVKEALERVPGVTFSSNGGPGTYDYTFIRGMDYDHIKILVDGIQVKRLRHIMAADIERIEVLKGNQSSLYGSDAIGGVISITTKSGKNSSKLVEGSAFGEYGSYHTYKTGVNARGRYGKFYYSGGVTQYDSDSIDISANTGGSSENDGYENFTADLRVGADVLENVGVLDKLNLEYLFRFMDSQVEYDNTGAVDAIDQGSALKRNNHMLALNTDMFNGVLRNEVKVSYFTESTAYYENGGQGPNSKDRHTKYEYKGIVTPNDMHTFVFGMDYEKESISDGTMQRSQQGIYGNYQIDLLDEALTLTAGGRFDKVDSVDSEFTYRTTANYNLDETGTRFHASYGTGFRAPSASEINGGTSSVVNNLKPEKTRGYDFGVEQSLLEDRVVLNVTAFNTRITDMIQYQGGWPGPYIYKNISSARTYGLETTLSVEATDELDFQLSHMYQEAKDLSADGPLSLRPGHAGTAQVNYAPNAVDGLSSWLRATYQGANIDTGGSAKDYIGGYVVWDVGANYEWEHGITFYGRVENLFDKHYEVKAQYAEPGISGYIGARVKF